MFKMRNRNMQLPKIFAIVTTLLITNILLYRSNFNLNARNINTIGYTGYDAENIISGNTSEPTEEDIMARKGWNEQTEHDIMAGIGWNEPTEHDIMAGIGWNEWCDKYQRNNLTFTKYTDKHVIKNIIKSMTPDLRIAREFGYVQNASDITEEFVSSLPKSYIVKGSHLSQSMVVVEGKNAKCIGFYFCLRWKRKESITHFLRRSCNNYIRNKFMWKKKTVELFYNDIPHGCLFEEAFPPELVDYNVYVFHGKAMFTDIYSCRSGNSISHITVTPNWVGMQTSEKNNTHYKTASVLPGQQPPVFWKNMLAHAEIIGRHFVHARIDFFVFGEEYAFAEITAATGNCHFDDIPAVFEKFYGYVVSHPEVQIDPEYIVKLMEKYGAIVSS